MHVGNYTKAIAQRLAEIQAPRHETPQQEHARLVQVNIVPLLYAELIYRHITDFESQREVILALLDYAREHKS